MDRYLNHYLRELGRKSFRALLSESLTNISAGSALIVTKGFFIIHAFSSYIGGVGATSGISMTPTISYDYRSQPYILYSSLHRRMRNLHVGDVITYTHPILPQLSGCKRIIGMPGDFVSVVTPGRRDSDLSAVDVEGKWASVREELIRVPEGHCWIQGDNLEWSRDSRSFGPLLLGLVKAKVLAVILPFEDAKWLGSERDVMDPQEGEREWVMK